MTRSTSEVGEALARKLEARADGRLTEDVPESSFSIPYCRRCNKPTEGSCIDPRICHHTADEMGGSYPVEVAPVQPASAPTSEGGTPTRDDDLARVHAIEVLLDLILVDKADRPRLETFARQVRSMPLARVHSEGGSEAARVRGVLQREAEDAKRRMQKQPVTAGYPKGYWTGRHVALTDALDLLARAESPSTRVEGETNA